jgi:acid phosphatase family membrane protein YuiD
MSFPLFIVPILVGLATQAMKPVLNKGWAEHYRYEKKFLPRYGGMPSAHTSFAFSIATVVAMSEGFNSAAFAITVVVVIFILDDALRMRIFLGRHGQSLIQLINKLPKEERVKYPHLETQLGHKPVEVVAGAIIGTILTVIAMIMVG